MAKKNNNEKKTIKRENWSSSFNLIGEAKVNDYTFKIDEKAQSSAWIYNSLNLGVDCGEKYGTVYAEMMGGYSDERENVIYAHGKNEDGSDNFEEAIQVDWDDRFDEDVLDTIGDLCFITVGLEQTSKGKTFYKKFLSAYDAILYIQEKLEDGMVVNVKGGLKYSLYNEKVMVRKTINSIVLSHVDDPAKYKATFSQSVLINKGAADIKNIDKDKGVMYVDATVLDYVKELNGVEIKGQYPFVKQFEYEFPDLKNAEQCKKIMDKLFKVKKGYTQITFEGDLIEGGATITATLDDIPQDIKDLIEIGVYTEEEALARCSTNGNREQRMVLRKPVTRLVGEDKIPTLQKFEEKYSEDDLDFSFVSVVKEDKDENEDEETESNTESTDSADDLDWLNSL